MPSDRGMASHGERKHPFNGKKDTSKFFYVYANVVMKKKTREEMQIVQLHIYMDTRFRVLFRNFVSI